MGRAVKQTVAFLGTGIMGVAMCRNILNAGFPVRVWNRTAAKAAELSADGATVCASPDEAVSGAEFVVVMLSTGQVVGQVLFSTDSAGQAVVDAASPGATVIVMSSIPVAMAKQQHQHLDELGLRYIDAPVSGGELGAQEGTLSIMAGGDPDVVAAASALLGSMGNLNHVGPAGCGQLAKLANQTIVGITIGAVAEALILARAGGADVAAVRQALLGGFAKSAILEQHGERMINENFVPGAKSTIQLKDLRTSQELAQELGADLPFLNLSRSLYETMCDSDRRDLDHSALFLELADRCRPED